MKDTQLPKEIEKRFDCEFAVTHNLWGDDFAWADDTDAMATRIKQFISQELSTLSQHHEAEMREAVEKVDLDWNVKSINNVIKNYLLPRMNNAVGKISDGYHTFNELYEFRKLYNATLFNEWAAQDKYGVHKSERHSDGELCFGGGWFIVMAQLPTGQISNHYEMKDWELFKIPHIPIAKPWDGHTEKDVLERLKSSLQTQEKNT